MARITRALQKTFGGAVTPANQIAQFASTITGTPIYSNDPAVLQALAAFENGALEPSLIQTGGGQNSPVFQEFNGLFYLLTRQLAYLMQAGIPEWIATETYYIGQFASDGAGVLYVSQTNANINNALTDTNNWLPFSSTISGKGIAKAWVTFTASGATGTKTILDSFNVSSVTKNSTGRYTIAFPGGIFANANYSFAGTGTAPNGTDTPAEPAYISGTWNEAVLKTTTQARIFAISPFASGSLVDPPQVTIHFFGS